MKIIVEKQKIIVIVKNNIAIRIAGKVSRYIDASMNRATPSFSGVVQPLGISIFVFRRDRVCDVFSVCYFTCPLGFPLKCLEPLVWCADVLENACCLADVLENACCLADVLENACCLADVLENACCLADVLENACCMADVLENACCMADVGLLMVLLLNTSTSEGKIKIQQISHTN